MAPGILNTMVKRVTVTQIFMERSGLSVHRDNIGLIVSIMYKAVKYGHISNVTQIKYVKDVLLTLGVHPPKTMNKVDMWR